MGLDALVELGGEKALGVRVVRDRGRRRVELHLLDRVSSPDEPPRWRLHRLNGRLDVAHADGARPLVEAFQEVLQVVRCAVGPESSEARSGVVVVVEGEAA